MYIRLLDRLRLLNLTGDADRRFLPWLPDIGANSTPVAERVGCSNCGEEGMLDDVAGFVAGFERAKSFENTLRVASLAYNTMLQSCLDRDKSSTRVREASNNERDERTNEEGGRKTL